MSSIFFEFCTFLLREGVGVSQRKKNRAESKSQMSGTPSSKQKSGTDEIDFTTVVWSLAILALLVLLHRLIWGG